MPSCNLNPVFLFTFIYLLVLLALLVLLSTTNHSAGVPPFPTSPAVLIQPQCLGTSHLSTNQTTLQTRLSAILPNRAGTGAANDVEFTAHHLLDSLSIWCVALDDRHPEAHLSAVFELTNMYMGPHEGSLGIAAGECMRTYCEDTTGVFVVNLSDNDEDSHAHPPWTRVNEMAEVTAKICTTWPNPGYVDAAHFVTAGAAVAEQYGVEFMVAVLGTYC